MNGISLHHHSVVPLPLGKGGKTGEKTINPNTFVLGLVCNSDDLSVHLLLSSCSFGLLTTLYAWAFVVFTLTELGKNT